MIHTLDMLRYFRNFHAFYRTGKEFLTQLQYDGLNVHRDAPCDCYAGVLCML